ncbi:flavodoxin family protein [Chloroflexota bacterium]
MKVLGIVCSPRKGGNTEIMVEEALAAAREAGAQTEIVLVANKNIAQCDGCDSCRETGVCRIKDDMQTIYQQLEASDAIIFGTPVYFGNVSAQAKTIIDRTFSLRGQRKLSGKVAASVVVARRVGAAQVRTFLSGFFVNQRMVAVRGAVGYGSAKGEIRQGVGGTQGLLALDEARNVGSDIVQMVERLSKPTS